MAGIGTRGLVVRPEDISLLMIRAMLATVFLFHGSQKLFGWFGGSGVYGFADSLLKLGIPFPVISAVLAGSAEFFGGLLLLTGTLTRLAVVPMAFTMLIACTRVHFAAFDGRKGGVEYPLTLLVILVAIGVSGAGRISVDQWLKDGGRR